MHTLEAIKQRRAVKHYDSDFKVPAEDIETLDEAITMSPTAFNIQNYRILKVSSPDLREKIKAAAWGQAQVTDASLLYIFCGDLKAYDREPARYWQNAPEEVRDWMVDNITKYYKDKPQVQRDEVMRSCGIAAQTLMLAAKSLGYDSCPMDGFDFAEVAKLVNLPDDHALVMFVVVGKAKEAARPKGGFIPRNEAFISDKF